MDEMLNAMAERAEIDGDDRAANAFRLAARRIEILEAKLIALDMEVGFLTDRINWLEESCG